MWQSTVWRGSPPSSSTMSSTVVPEAEPARQVDHQRQAGARLRAGGAAQATSRSSGVKSDGDADLADQADARRRRCHRAPRRTISSAMASTDMPATSGGCELCR